MFMAPTGLMKKINKSISRLQSHWKKFVYTKYKIRVPISIEWSKNYEHPNKGRRTELSDKSVFVVNVNNRSVPSNH